MIQVTELDVVRKGRKLKLGIYTRPTLCLTFLFYANNMEVEGEDSRDFQTWCHEHGVGTIRIGMLTEDDKSVI